LRTYTIVTTEPNEILAPIHNRMPVMLSDRDALEWVRGDGEEIAHALSSLKPFPAELMDGYDVSKLVNNPQNDSPECIAPNDALEPPCSNTTAIGFQEVRSQAHPTRRIGTQAVTFRFNVPTAPSWSWCGSRFTPSSLTTRTWLHGSGWNLLG